MDSSGRKYVPVPARARMTWGYSLYQLLVAPSDAPDQVCGVARRVGYTGSTPNAPAIYRLRVKTEGKRRTMTLAGFFIVENGAFVEYDRWRSLQK
jgi:hypothetical protein